MADPTSVDAYLAAVPPKHRALLRQLRTTIRAAAPDATETISYQMPAFKDRNGRALVWYAAFKDHCSLFPASDGVMKALGNELEPFLSGKGTIRFTSERPIPARLVKRIVDTRLRENASRDATSSRGRGRDGPARAVR